MITSSMQSHALNLVATNQIFNITILNTTYTFHINWRGYSYILDINDSSDNPILNGIPLVMGTDLLGQFEYLFPDWGLVVYGSGSVSDWSALGSTVNLYAVY